MPIRKPAKQWIVNSIPEQKNELAPVKPDNANFVDIEENVHVVKIKQSKKPGSTKGCSTKATAVLVSDLADRGA